MDGILIKIFCPFCCAKTNIDKQKNIEFVGARFHPCPQTKIIYKKIKKKG